MSQSILMCTCSWRLHAFTHYRKRYTVINQCKGRKGVHWFTCFKCYAQLGSWECFHRLWIDYMATFFEENKPCRTMFKNVRIVHSVLNNSTLISCQFGIDGYNFSKESFFGRSSSSYAALFSNHKPSKRKSFFSSKSKNDMAVNISSTLRTVRRRDYWLRTEVRRDYWPLWNGPC